MHPPKHDATLNQNSAVFFGDPRSALGAIRSAETTVDPQAGRPWGCAVLIGAAVATGGFFAANELFVRLVKPALRELGLYAYASPAEYLVIPASFVAFVLETVLTLWALARIRPSATYVCEHGIARYRRERNGTLTGELLRYSDIADVRAKDWVSRRRAVRTLNRTWAFVDTGGVVRIQVSGYRTEYLASTLYFKQGEGPHGLMIGHIFETSRSSPIAGWACRPLARLAGPGACRPETDGWFGLGPFATDGLVRSRVRASSATAAETTSSFRLGSRNRAELGKIVGSSRRRCGDRQALSDESASADPRPF